jgi:hypothetical protein
VHVAEEIRAAPHRPNRLRSYCPPLIIESAGRKQFVLTGSHCTTSYDPDTGKLIWIVDGPTEQFVAGMVFLDNAVFLSIRRLPSRKNIQHISLLKIPSLVVATMAWRSLFSLAGWSALAV